MTIGQRLKRARKIRRISQDALANQIGASRGVITNIERDIVETPQPMVVNALCNALDINKEWLLNGTMPMEQDKETLKSEKVLSEIHEYSKDLSEEEQQYVLDLIKTYIKHKPSIK